MYVFGAHTSDASYLPLITAALMSGGDRLTNRYSSDLRPNFLARHSAAPQWPVELVVTGIVLPFSSAGFLRYASALSLVAITVMIPASSSAIPIVCSPYLDAPSTEGMLPAPPTSHEPDEPAAISTAPDANVDMTGFKPISFHQPFSEAINHSRAQRCGC